MNDLEKPQWSNEKKRKIIDSIKSIVWTLTVAIYFILGFTFNNWRYPWIVFIVAIAINKIIALSIEMRY